MLLMASKKKVIIAIASAVAAIAILVCVADRVAEARIRAALSDVPEAEITPRKVRVSLLPGKVELKDLAFATRDSSGKVPVLQGNIAALKLNGLHWRRLFKREVLFSELQVDNGSLDGLVGNLNFSIKNIGYNFADSTLVYSDSSCTVSLDSLDIVTPDQLTRIQIGHLEQTAAGPVKARALHLYSNVPREELAIKMGKVAAMWFDVTLDSLSTSAVDIPRIIKSKEVKLASIRLSGPNAVILQDDRFPPAVPYPTIQESFNALKIPIKIGEVDASFDTFTFIWETTRVNRGTFPMQHVRLKLSSIGNAPGNVMGLSVQSGLPGQSSLDFSAHIHNDKEESVNGRYLIENLDASKLDGFVRPLFGATMRADIHKAEGSFTGNKHAMNARFEMLYDHLSVKAWNDASAPIKLVSKHSKTLTFIANIALPKANPSRAGEEPRVVEYSYERDVMTPYVSYLIQGLTNGMLHTLVPEYSVNKVSK